MEKSALHDTLQRLHQELEKATTVDEEVRQLLRSTMQDIQTVLDETGAPQVAQHRPLINRLKEATVAFEVSHPDLTAAVGRVIDTLSSMGI